MFNNVSHNVAFDVSGVMMVNGVSYELGSTVSFDKDYRVVGIGSSGLEELTPISAPTNVQTGTTSSSIIVSWSPVTNATGYTVSLYSNVARTALVHTNSASSPYTITSLNNSTLYYGKVTALYNGPSLYTNSSPALFVATTATGTSPIPDGSGAVIPCFFGNARVLTPVGYRRMDSLKVGDFVMTPQGSEAVIERVKVTVCPAGPNTNPYVIPAGTFGASHRLLISPDHKVCLPDGRRVEAKKLGLEQETREGSLTYYNLELVGCADMVVGGVAVESLAPVRRVVMSMAAFEAAVKSRYGSVSASVLANIKRTCRLVGPNAVEVPVMRR